MTSDPARAGDHRLPRYHVRPRTGYVNDPNGPLYVDSRWHLYFQYTHDTPRRGAVVWGHASSADLVRWRLHRPAMSPDPSGADRDGCWSGNTVLVDGEVTAFYSGYRREHPYQSVLSATSVDGGNSFGPPRQVVADPDPSDGVVVFRDPFVWREAGVWLMVVGAGDAADRASARLYESADLQAWKYRGPFAELPRTRSDDLDSGQMWECPQFIAFGQRGCLLVAAYDVSGGIMHVLAVTGERDEFRLRDTTLSRVDDGSNFYAASALRESDVGPVIWGWATEGRSADWAAEDDWSGMLTLPRSVSLTDDGRLASAPLPGLTSLREAAAGARTGTDEGRRTFRGLPAQFEAELLFAAHRGTDLEPTRLSLRCGPEERLDVAVDWRTGRVTVDRDRASRDPRAHGGSYSFDEPQISASGTLALRWFVDGSISELFTGSGRCSTVRFYPTSPPPWDLELSGLTSDDSVEVWPLSAAVATG